MEVMNQRTVYGQTLVELGGENPNIVALEADLGRSTMSCLFKDAFPDRYFEMGIAEQNMMSVAAGLALGGKIPFASTFAVFASGRAYDQFRQTISIAGLNVKVCGSSSGLSDFGDGSTHQAVEDIALLRGIPNVSLFVPADARETKRIVRYMAEHSGPMYVRVNRNDLPNVTGGTGEIGKVSRLRDGKDAVIYACGVMAGISLDAAKVLEQEGISVRVVNVSCIKPLDREGVLREAQGMRGAVTAEEHSIIGGLGSAVVEALRETPLKTEFVGVEDRFGTSAHGYQELLEYYGLTAGHVAESVRKVIK